MLIEELESYSNPGKSIILSRFFKTGKGEYGEGDVFLGIVVPIIRKIAKKYIQLPLSELDSVISNKYHEVRLCALLILTYKYLKADIREKEKIYRYYLQHIRYVNNWDLVDLTAPHIIGAYIYDHPDRKSLLLKLAHSKNLWQRRIAILSTFYFIQKKESNIAFQIATILLHDSHDLIHKAVGWMLREIGKRCSEKELIDFLKTNYPFMPRTMLRYAIEKFPELTRRKYLLNQF